jgi:hypothetical protein
VLLSQVIPPAIAGLAVLSLFTPIKSTAAIQTLLAQSFGVDTINIYCTSNQDGTGECVNSDNNSIVDCTLIPGQVITCRDSQSQLLSCINYGSNQSSQGYFQCSPKSDSGQDDS